MLSLLLLAPSPAPEPVVRIADHDVRFSVACLVVVAACVLVVLAYFEHNRRSG